MKSDAVRKEMIKRYGQLYKRVKGFDLELCAYCGAGRQALDHVPALSLLPGINVKQYIKNGGKFLLYPVCHQCNRYLNNKPYVGYLERLDYLEGKYIEKIDTMEVWTSKEIGEMTGMMKAYIEANQYKVQILIRKLETIDENRLKHEYDDLG